MTKWLSSFFLTTTDTSEDSETEEEFLGDCSIRSASVLMNGIHDDDSQIVHIRRIIEEEEEEDELVVDLEAVMEETPHSSPTDDRLVVSMNGKPPTVESSKKKNKKKRTTQKQPSMEYDIEAHVTTTTTQKRRRSVHSLTAGDWTLLKDNYDNFTHDLMVRVGICIFVPIVVIRPDSHLGSLEGDVKAPKSRLAFFFFLWPPAGVFKLTRQLGSPLEGSLQNSIFLFLPSNETIPSDPYLYYQGSRFNRVASQMTKGEFLPPPKGLLLQLITKLALFRSHRGTRCTWRLLNSRGKCLSSLSSVLLSL
ncbi:expressed unknown protein [Seminavis robusta]|uniref:Uncharacterized protein n=1 Tax=Seminavis robusta TaxID=568900 RepID=A0A9N8DS54_9STRA|nr:expressed unknown protein [Seminavis robusta]|eukprot:Sro214_g088620.1 n/a (307) ;mRNA; r:511-1431